MKIQMPKVNLSITSETKEVKLPKMPGKLRVLPKDEPTYRSITVDGVYTKRGFRKAVNKAAKQLTKDPDFKKLTKHLTNVEVTEF